MTYKEIGERLGNLALEGLLHITLGVWFYFGVMGWYSWRTHAPVEPTWDMAGVFIVGAVLMRFIDKDRPDDEEYDEDEEQDGETDHERTSV
jgi:hypothetical protein